MRFASWFEIEMLSGELVSWVKANRPPAQRDGPGPS